MKNLHITNTDKFIQPFIEFIDTYFNPEFHTFAVILDKDDKRFKESFQNVQYINNNYNMLRLVKILYKYDRIYLHGLFNMKVILILFLQPWLLKKCSWIIWGADLYRYQRSNTTLKSKVYEHMRKRVIKNMGQLLPLVEGDYYLAKKWYGVRGQYKIARYNNMERNNYGTYLADRTKFKEPSKECINIHIGNSATPSNNHIEILNDLERYKEQNIRIYCPLVYGDSDYAYEIKKYGKSIFCEKFIVIDKMMDIQSYLTHLNAMDIGIFNNNRQQGLGNISPLLLFGKKVYLNNRTTMWDFYKQDNFHIYSFNAIKEKEFNDFVEMPFHYKRTNYEKMRKKFTDQYSIDVWKEIFNEK